MLCILVVDDDAANRALARAVLEREYRVVDAADGPTALAVVEQEAVDLVLLDVMMPGMSGLEVCRAIKALPRADYLPVILLTALAEQEERISGLEAGADEFLTKPFVRRELLLRVRTFLRLREQDREIRAQVVALHELGELKDDLVSLLVHDVRNPLAAAMAVVEAMEPGLGPVRASDIAILQRQHERMCGLLEDALLVRQLEAPGAGIDRSTADLAEVVRLALDTCGPMCRARSVQVSPHLEDVPTLAVDAALVRRAVENLLSNALKYAPAGSIVDVWLARAGAGAVIRVEDRGPGIAQPVRDRMFEKFCTVAKGAGGAARGFGLGLYLVRLVAAAHGGTAAAADRDGGGTVATLTLFDAVG